MKSLVCDGIEYKSIKEFANSLKVSPQVLNNNINIKNRTPEEIKRFYTRELYHIIDEKITAIFLRNITHKIVGIAYIDTNKLEDVIKWSKYWSLLRSGYVASTKNKRRKYLHQLILNVDCGMEVDHIDGNKLDNRIKNLRQATRSQNGINRLMQKNNTSGFKGVSKHKYGWRSRIKFKNKEINMGLFKTPIEAARAYDKKAIELYGEFAKTNEALGLLRRGE